MRLTAKNDSFVAEIRGIDISGPIENADRLGLKEALLRFGVLILPDQALQRDELQAFAEVFGRPAPNADISNVREDGEIVSPEALAEVAAANSLWHMDITYQAKPCLASILYAVEIPMTGGDTQFADLRAAWSALPLWNRLRLKRAKERHSLTGIRRRMGLSPMDGEAIHPVAPKHPETGRRSLLLSSHAEQDELIAFASQDRFVYTHVWTRGDLIIWDNRCIMHRVLPYAHDRDRRVLYRAEVR